jgi:hypothetical protein
VDEGEDALMAFECKKIGVLYLKAV